MRFLNIAIFLLLSCAIYGQGVRKVLNKPETSNYVVIRDGGVFMFDPSNMRANAGGSFNRKENLLIIKPSQRVGQFFQSNRYIWVNPYAQYRIDYSIKSNSATDFNLKIGADLFTNSRKEIVTRSKDALLKEHAGNGTWQTGSLILNTTFDTRYLRLTIFNEIKSNINCEIKDVTITQISQQDINSISDKVVSVSKMNSGSKQSVSFSKPYSHFRIYFGIANVTLAKDPEITFKWYSKGKVIAENNCKIKELKGIESQWNGLRIEWFRDWSFSPSKTISVKAENIFKGDAQKTVFDGLFPEGADQLVAETSNVTLADLNVILIR